MDIERLTDEVLDRCDALGRVSDQAGRLTRTFLSPATKQTHALVADWMRDAGLTVRCDAVGNLIGRSKFGGERAFLVGSHIDTVPNAGKYDGVLGVMIGIAAAKALAEQTFTHSLEVIAFSEEEGVRFRMPYLGSRAVCGQFDPAWLHCLDEDGITLESAIRTFGLDPARIPEVAYSPGRILGYLEPHIEQGPVLEMNASPLGVVTAIAGQSRFEITLTGVAGHAGTLPMDMRRDALAGAAEWILAVEQAARQTNGLVATVGRIALTPGATNVVPGEATLSLDVRHADDNVRQAAAAELLNLARAIGSRRNLSLTIMPMAEQPAVPCDPALTGRLAACALNPPRLVSGAGHDAAIMASVCPSAMLFIHCPNGISHHPDEAVNRADVRCALIVTIAFVTRELQ